MITNKMCAPNITDSVVSLAPPIYYLQTNEQPIFYGQFLTRVVQLANPTNIFGMRLNNSILNEIVLT